MGYRNVDLNYAKRCVGLGWHGLVDQFYKDMDALGVEYQVDQIKEKFGCLRIYITTTGVDFKTAYSIVQEVEEASSKICENCGSPGTIRDDMSWILTLCDDCYQKVKYSKEET